MIGSVKEFSITLNAFHYIRIIQDIIIVDLPPLFEICLSREFTTKLGGYLALDYTYLLLPFKKNYVKVLNDGIKNVYLMKLSEQNCMNGFEQIETFDRDLVMESLLNIKIHSINDLNY